MPPLIYSGASYNAHFEMDSQDSTRSRLFWKANFADVLKEELSDWYTIYHSQSETNVEPATIRFEKKNSQGTVYKVNLIIPSEIDYDIESEIEEEQQACP